MINSFKVEGEKKMQMQEKIEKIFGTARKVSKNDSNNSQQRFLDVRREPTSRCKHLRLLLDGIGDPGAKKSFVELHSFETFHVFHELLCQIETTTLQNGGSRLAAHELECVFYLLEIILCYLPELVARRWQYSAIGLSMKQLLQPQNFIGVRRLAMRLFLQWYQILSQGPYGTAELDGYFANLVPHLSVDGKSSEQRLSELCESPSMKCHFSRISDASPHQQQQPSTLSQFSTRKPVAIAPSSAVEKHPTVSQTVADSRCTVAQTSMEKLLEFISSDVSKIEWAGEDRQTRTRHCLQFLMNKLLQYYVPVCLSGWALSMDAFSPQLPNDIQAGSPPALDSEDPLTGCRHAIVRWVAAYAFSHKRSGDSLNANGNDDSFLNRDRGPKSPTRGSEAKLPPNFDLVRECLFGCRPMVSLVVGTFAEAFLLPISCANTMGRVFKTLREWIVSDDQPPFFNEPLGTDEPHAGRQCAYMSIVAVISSFFYSPYLNREQERTTLVVQISTKLLALFRYLACNSTQLTAETWRFLLKCALGIVDRWVPISQTSSSVVMQRLPALLFQTLFVVWVYAGLNGGVSSEMWDELLETLSPRTFYPELIVEWSKVIESVTRALGVMVFGVDVLDLPLDRLSEQKLIRHQGAMRSRLQKPFEQTSASSLSAVGSPPDEAANSKHLYDFVQRTSSNATYSNSNGSTGRSMKPKLSLSPSAYQESQTDVVSKYSAQTQPSVANDETSLDGSGSDMASQSTGEQVTFYNDLMGANNAQCDDVDDSISEEFTIVDSVNGSIGDATTADLSAGEDQEQMLTGCGPATIFIVWSRMVGCFGNLNKLPSPSLHLAAFQTLEQLIVNLLKMKDNQNVAVDQQQLQRTVSPPSIVPQPAIVAPWLLESLSLPEAFRESKSLAIRLLCRILSQRSHRCPAMDRALTAQFLALIRKSVIDGDEMTAGIILGECGCKLICADLSAGILTICDMVRAAALLLSSDVASKSDRISAVRYLSSIVCVPMAVSDAGFPCLSADSQMKLAQGTTVQREVVQLLRQLVESNVEHHLKTEAVKGVGVYIADQLHRSDSKFCDDYLQTLLNQLPHLSSEIGLLICQALHPLLELPPQQQRVSKIVEALTTTLENSLRDLSGSKISSETLLQRERYATRLTLDIMDWCALLPHYQRSDYASANGSASAAASRMIVDRLANLCYSPVSRDVHAAGLIGRLLLTFLCLHFNQGGAAQSLVTETSAAADDGALRQHSLVFGLRKNCLLSIQQPTAEKCPSRLLFRHVGGKRAWELRRINSVDAKSENASRVAQESFNHWLQSKSNASMSAAAENITPPSITKSEDILDNFMHYLSISSAECFTNAGSFESPTVGHCATTVAHEETLAAAISQLQLKWRLQNVQNTSEESTILEPAWATIPGVLHRHLLGSGLLLNLSYGAQHQTYTLDGSDRLNRELKHLDGLFLSETHKIAVLYVAEGQEDKQSILSNHCGSTNFESFVEALGWRVNLRQHRGYAGGLTADFSSSTVYYATATSETVFHVSTQLPNDDPTKIVRHLGNDEVHIIWSEHWRDYRRSIIATEFCDVLIAIYPVPDTGLFRIRIEKRAEILDFGPLSDNALVPWPALPSLVRCTAINASRAKRASVSNYKNFYEHRADSLQQTVERLHTPSSYSNLLGILTKCGVEQQKSAKKPLARTA